MAYSYFYIYVVRKWEVPHHVYYPTLKARISLAVKYILLCFVCSLSRIVFNWQRNWVVEYQSGKLGRDWTTFTIFSKKTETLLFFVRVMILCEFHVEES